MPRQTEAKLESSPNFDVLPDSALLDQSRAAEFLCLSEHALQIWRTTGRYGLPYCKIGRKIRYRLGDLREFLENRMRTHTGEKN